MRRVALFALCAEAACGTPAPAVVQLPPTASASAAPSSPVTLLTTSCSEWKACRAAGEPIRVSESKIGQSPNVVWDGQEALVVFDTPSEGTHLVAVKENHVAWNETLPGTSPEIAWNPRTRAGLVMTSETIAWLGRDGKPVHRTNAPRVTNIGFHGGVAASGDGFLIASGVSSHASNAPHVTFDIAHVGAPADAIDWKRVDDDGLRYPPLVSSDHIVSQPFKSYGRLFIVSKADEAQSGIELSNPPSAHPVAFDPPTFIIFADEKTHALSFATANSLLIDLGVRSTRSGSAALLQIGSTLVLGADKIGDSAGVALAPLDLEHAPYVGSPLAIGPSNSQRLRVVATERGFVATWNIADDGAPLVPLMNHTSMHGVSAMLAVYTCCP